MSKAPEYWSWRNSERSRVISSCYATPKVDFCHYMSSFCLLMIAFSLGAIELPLVCARVFDKDNYGLNYWQSGATGGDDVHHNCYEQRMRCYELILDSLSVFEGQGSQPTQSSTLPSDDLDAVRSHAYELAFSSDDVMFHSVLYDWLIGRQLADDLLEVSRTYRVVESLLTNLYRFAHHSWKLTSGENQCQLKSINCCGSSMSKMGNRYGLLKF
jgi:hypothetical protein